MLEKGGTSVIHSSISIANENVSEWVVMEPSLCSISSGAAYLVTVNDLVFDRVTSSLSLAITIPAIPKSHICGSPLRVYGQSHSEGGVGTWQSIPHE